MGANTAGIYGAQLYRSDDEPRYRRAFSVCIAVLSLGALLATIRKIDEIIARRRKQQQVEEPEHTPERQLSYAELKPGPRPSNAVPQPVQVASDVKPVVAQET